MAAVGAGIGAAALGAAIGYAMWKKYKEHEAGKDVTVGKSRLEQVRYLQTMGMSEDQAISMQAGMAAGDVSMSKEGIENYMKLTKNMADQTRMFGDFQVEDMQSLQRGEQLLFADQMEAGVFGDASKYAGLVEIIRKQQLVSGEQLESVTSMLSSQIGTQANLKTSQEEIESRWYAGNIGGVHWNLLGGGQANRRARQDEERVREV